MELNAGTPTKRRLVDRVVICLLIGVVAASVGGATLLTVYLNRLDDAAEGLHRAEPLPAYPGRPDPVVVDGVAAVNYLLMGTDEHGRLDAVLIAHLSASRKELSLIALPADLVADTGAGHHSLAASFAADPLATTRAVESLTGARMDHQLRLDLAAFAAVVDSLDGIELAGSRMDGGQVLAHLADAPDPLARSVRTAHLLRATLDRADLGVAIADPNRFDKVMDALTPCLVVDAGLTGEEIRTTMVESRVRADAVVTWPLVATTAPSGVSADPAGLAALRTALAADAVPSAVPAPTSAPRSVHSTPAALQSTTPWTAEPSTTPPGPTPDDSATPEPTR